MTTSGRHQCAGKKRYTEAQAIHSGYRFGNRRYKCRLCGYWHTTKKNKERVKFFRKQQKPRLRGDPPKHRLQITTLSEAIELQE